MVAKDVRLALKRRMASEQVSLHVNTGDKLWRTMKHTANEADAANNTREKQQWKSSHTAGKHTYTYKSVLFTHMLGITCEWF